MAMSKLNAWTIFKSFTLGELEGGAGVAALVGDEVTEYQAHVEQFNLELAQKIVLIQNEAAAILNDHPVAKRLEFTPAHEYTAADYIDLVSIFAGSTFEKLHLTGFFRIQNTELLFDLVRPAA